MYGKLIAGMAFTLSAVCPCAMAAGRYSITAAQVSQAIAATGVAIAPESILLMSDVSAASPEPRLHVESADRAADGQLVVRMACDSSALCLPFLVSVRAGSEVNARLAAVVPAGGFGSRATAQGVAVIRNGAQAVLVLEGTHVHIQLPVVALENGAVGQRIRVTEKEKHLTYTAVVINSGLLQGRIQR